MATTDQRAQPAAPPPAPTAAEASAPLDLRGRTAVVTGAASGIGRACALRLAAAGAEVRLVDRDADGVRALAESGAGTAVPADLADPDAAEEIGRGADIVLNNAGFQLVSPVEEFPPEEFSRMLRVMVEAPFRTVRAALPHMYRRGWGRIVNVSSVHGRLASPYKSAYVTAKHALEGLSKAVAVEGAARGVTSNCVAPGYVRTPLVEAQLADQAAAHGLDPGEVAGRVLLARTPAKRLLEPEEVAEAVAYLCGPAASFVNGASLTLDGGWSAG
ncbi:3-hydroxybutyrate dehydrogenase [Nocardiopsis sp. CNT-189]|uniref:3-hydroxybutyrate dehydrogenase n=1 Tax=Nocardiopsis oceanisediminis TaxID=2816862 RepID=UPI003B33EBF4